jgi:hypothetical protein
VSAHRNMDVISAEDCELAQEYEGLLSGVK